MKFKMMVLSCLMCAIILATGYEYLQAQPNVSGTTSKIGVISVHTALRNCQATLKFTERLKAEQEKMISEENKLATDHKALADSLRVFKPDSSEYMETLQKTVQKQSELKALQEVNPRRSRLRQMQWTQKIYTEILRITRELAAQKGLTLVLAAEEPEFPFKSYEELVMTLSTNKVLYNNGCVDLTGEVIAELDKIQSKLGS
ncbi:MAG: OmpH family outer membrane protein [Sedimentisphaerales bacterium]|nr:OmpH family outer membrane protein [Sedimentisphaerales bacterium]